MIQSESSLALCCLPGGSTASSILHRVETRCSILSAEASHHLWHILTLPSAASVADIPRQGCRQASLLPQPIVSHFHQQVTKSRSLCDISFSAISSTNHRVRVHSTKLPFIKCLICICPFYTLNQPTVSVTLVISKSASASVWPFARDTFSIHAWPDYRSMPCQH